MKYLGLDGCKAGWFLVGLDEQGSGAFGILECIDELAEYLPDAEVALIDIPIGLRGEHPDERTCDKLARRVLRPKRHSSVFPAPSRLALDCTTYREASERNHACTGRGLTQQTFNIMPKIREVDAFLRGSPLRGRVREMHPEVALWALNDKRAMAHAKRTTEGFEERMAVLSRYLPNSREIVSIALQQHRRKALVRDDIVDALVGAVTAWFHPRLRCLPEAPEFDDMGLPMEIVFAEPGQAGV